MSNQRITVEATIPAPPATVWKAYTTPAHITQWNFASDDWCCPSADVDLRVGGMHKARMAARDDSMAFDFMGTYQQVEPERALSMVLEDGRQVRTTFERVDEGTRVTTVFDAESQNPIEMQRDGWQAILNNFKKHVEQLP